MFELKYFFIFILGLFFVELSKKIAIKYNIVDKPNSAVKTHTKATPYLGGLGIILTFYISFFIFNTYKIDNKHLIELLSLFIMFILGLLDDKYNLSIKTRWIVQFAIAFSLIAVENVLNLTGIYIVDFIFTLIGILFMINAMNILDILDGLASGIAIIILSSFLIINSFIGGNEFYSFISIIYIIALLAFLVYNFNPASIFMGDAGSTVLGLFLAIIFINTFNTTDDSSIKFSSFIALSVPIFEVFYVSILRLKKGINPMKGSKDHFALRKRIMGHSVKETVILSYGITLMTLVASYIVIGEPFFKQIVIFTSVVISFIIFGYILSKIKID